MKNLLYTLVMISLLVSCRSVEKLVDEGKYDEAILLATKKLSGKKKKKTKHVVALEEAFAKVVDRDLDRIAFLKSQSRASNWEEIYSIYATIQRRENKIAAFLPLISNDGYRAAFKFIEVNDEMKVAAEGASEFHYQTALKNLEDARSGDKLAARQAYHRLERIEKYTFDYKDKRALSKEAYELGTTRILVNVVNEANVILPETFSDHVMSVRVSDLNTLWKEFHTSEVYGKRYDLFADLQILDLQISPALEVRDRWSETKKVKDGWKYKRDRKTGEIALDTLGNKIKIDKFKNVSADIVKVIREKEAVIVGNLIFRDVNTGIREQTRPINVVADFEDESYSYFGDKEALPSNVRNKISSPLNFPSDYDLTMEVAEVLKGRLKRELGQTTY